MSIFIALAIFICTSLSVIVFAGMILNSSTQGPDDGRPIAHERSAHEDQ